ncbi:Ig-like domain-containing protein [Xenorhabdus innexi]|uniref:Big-1 domain-containing protein n=1 Tax=Xenorhabdus innexi TaxID=290109 RepID=A0A1N6MZM3_9GAMM|nr:Ig-like domain-containing protein [Xenorhabdus innexi]PHM30488.1 hypothetical protein Xinn_03291 [Xenorhabdus innexi]SIP74232.1 conserved hypothetical protein [Xenorhabdus innexi]
MPIQKNNLVEPFLPQSYNGVIDESKLDQSILVIKINQYNDAHIGDVIVVHLNNYISSLPYYITEKNKNDSYYEITIPFSTIPLGNYNIFYTITDVAENTSNSATNSVKIIKSNTSTSSVISSLKIEVLTNGMPANDYTPNVVLITALDEKMKSVSGIPIHIASNDNMCITPSSAVTNQDGEVIFCVTSNSDGIFSIQATSGNVKEKAELYFSPIYEAILKITGKEQIGEEYEIITIQAHDKKTLKKIKNATVYYKTEQSNNINPVLIIGSNNNTIQLMSTDEYGQFKINLKGKVGGCCIISATANNYMGSVKYTKEKLEEN